MVAILREEPACYQRWPGAASAPLAPYARRQPETTALHRLVRTHLPDFLAQARERSAYGAGLPRFVERELARG